jgi:3D (Asp-Asp-Asp) domain-containing protein
VRVQERVLVEQEPLPFDTELQPVDDLELDSRKVVQAGEFGLTARSVRIRYEDGQEVSRKVEDEWIARQPQTRIMGYGTQIKIRTMNTPDGPIQYWRAVQMYATSYSPCRIYDDHCDSYTALGETLRKGIVAMTNQWCRTTCGDQVYVPGYGVGTVADTGGGIPGRYWIDLGYSEEDYVSWHQNVTVYFLTPVPSNIMWVLP